MPLFINEEAGGKQRLIANAKGGGHNEWTSDEETLFVIAVGFAADAAVMVTDECARLHLPEETSKMTTQQLIETMPDWIQLGLGCDDMTDAFRQSPVAPEHQGVNVVAFYAPSRGSWVFSEVYGLVYGMKSSVLHFNRFPALCAATARRMGGAATGSYVDDFTTIDFLMAGGSGQAFANLVINTNGGALGPEKHKPTSPRDLNRSCSGPASAWTASCATAQCSSSRGRRPPTRSSRPLEPSSSRRAAHPRKQPNFGGSLAGRQATPSAA